ncbi:MAG: peptidylprolyl isomerase, partial [Geobacter sp.]
MKKFRLKPILFVIILAVVSCKSPGSNENTIILMKTTLGDIKIKLYDGTPIHRDNFIKLVNSEIYNGISFHRVINSFMIQAGDPLTRQSGIPQGADSLNN